MKRRSTPRLRALVVATLLLGTWYLLLAQPPSYLLPHIPRGFAATAPYVAPPSAPLFTVPHVLAVHCNHDCTSVALFTAGIDMSYSKRNLTAVACRLGRRVVPATSFENDVLHCPAAGLAAGDVVAAVLRRDEALAHALRGPVTLATGVVAELSESDLRPLDGLSLAPGLDRARLVAVSADLVYQPPPPPRPTRWQVCLMTQIKPAPYLLPAWVDYHRRVGVDRVFIFDNGADEDIASMFAGRTDVEVLSWPYHKSQLALVGYFRLAVRDICEHTIHMDADEYFMFGLGSSAEFAAEPPIARYIRRATSHGYHAFRLAYITMANSGYRLRPSGPVPEHFHHRALPEDQVFFNGKALCTSDLDYESGRVHSCGIINSREILLYCEKPEKWGDINMYPTKLEDPGFVMHFRQRSWEEWIERQNAGWVVGRLVRDALSNTLDINNPPKEFMAVNKSLVYTHFRDVYRRVVKEGRTDRAFTVRRGASGKRCIRQVNMNRQFLPPTGEVCFDA